MANVDKFPLCACDGDHFILKFQSVATVNETQARDPVDENKQQHEECLSSLTVMCLLVERRFP